MFDDALAGVRNYLARPEHWIVGLMTGTSVDAVDAALVRFSGVGLSSAHSIIGYRESALEPALRREVLELAAAEKIAPETLMRVDAALGESYAAAVLDLLGHAGVQPERVDAIGAHGQTIRHVPRHRGGGHAFTLQIGSAAVLAERTGIPVVSNFRARDVAAGGEGAPLVPLVDWWLFRSASDSRVLLNLGGMANLTHLPRGGTLDSVLAFDTGPGNAVLDALAAELTSGAQTFDEGGALAFAGRVDDELLGTLLADPFFALPPPRSTGREHFGAAYARRLLDLARANGRSGADAMATATELTAASISAAIERFLAPRGGVEVVVASGGGVRNPALMSAIARRLPGVPVVDSDTLGVDPSAKEALAFAFLAHQTLCGLAGNVPSATGAARPVVLGQITPGRVR